MDNNPSLHKHFGMLFVCNLSSATSYDSHVNQVWYILFLLLIASSTSFRNVTEICGFTSIPLPIILVLSIQYLSPLSRHPHAHKAILSIPHIKLNAALHTHTHTHTGIPQRTSVRCTGAVCVILATLNVSALGPGIWCAITARMDQKWLYKIGTCFFIPCKKENKEDKNRAPSHASCPG